MTSSRFQPFIAGCLALAAVIGPACADFTTGQTADVVLGQPTFTTKAAATSLSGLNFPTCVSVDPASGKIFIADYVNNRVLRYSSAEAMISGGTPEFVFGQADYISSGLATTQNGLDFPFSILVDAGGRLWVSDTGNQRILRFDNAATRTSKLADGVLGQPDFSTNITGTTAAMLNAPAGLTVDSAGNLWVADSMNNRLLRFDHAATLANGSAASVVLGQTSFTASVTATSQSGMSQPMGLFTDANDTLWVTDKGNHRVVRFDHAASLPDHTTGGLADGVIGQPDFTTATLTSSGFDWPSSVLVDLAGNLYVADELFHRVLRFPNAATISSGGTPDLALGQVSFTASDAPNPPTAASLDNAGAVAMDASGRIWIADTGNSRVLRYTPAPEITVSPASQSVTEGSDVTFTVVAEGPDLTYQWFKGLMMPIRDATDATYTISAVTSDDAGDYHVEVTNTGATVRSFDAALTVNPVPIPTPTPVPVAPNPPRVFSNARISTDKTKINLSGTQSTPGAVVQYTTGHGKIRYAIGGRTWKLTVQLKPGKNTIHIQSLDPATGLLSPAKKIVIFRK